MIYIVKFKRIIKYYLNEKVCNITDKKSSPSKKSYSFKLLECNAIVII